MKCRFRPCDTTLEELEKKTLFLQLDLPSLTLIRHQNEDFRKHCWQSKEYENASFVFFSVDRKNIENEDFRKRYATIYNLLTSSVRSLQGNLRPIARP